MLLAIDIGNTNIVIGCIKDDEILFKARIATDQIRTSDQYGVEIKNMLEAFGIQKEDISDCIISSVVPPLTEIFRAAVKKLTGCHALVVGSGIKTGLNIQIDDPSTLGSDLVAAAVAAINQFPQPVIIIDMGTATTMTVVDKGNRFLGGAIIPGVALSMNALSSGTSLLHKVPLEAPKKCISGTTTACMQSGAVYGNAALLDGMIDRFEAELDTKATVVATGGIACKIIPHCRHEIIYDEDLLLKGLAILYRKNTKR